MKTSKPPFIAAWLLDRFGADPQLDAIAGDLLEQYQLGRSRFWYWREAITAITVGTCAAFRDHPRVMLRALVIGWILFYLMVQIGPVEYSLLYPYLSAGFPAIHHFEDRFPNIVDFVVGTLIGAPRSVLMGWMVARFARQCRMPTVLSFATTFLLFGVLANIILMMTENNEAFLTWVPFAGMVVLTILVLLGGGLLTGSPKRSTPML